MPVGSSSTNTSSKWNVGQLLVVFALLVNSLLMFYGVAVLSHGSSMGQHEYGDHHPSNLKSGWKLGGGDNNNNNNGQKVVSREQLHTVFQAVEKELLSSSSGGNSASSSSTTTSRALSPPSITDSGSSSNMAFTQHFRNLYQYQNPSLPFLRNVSIAQEECGPGPEYANFFKQWPNRRSRSNEDLTIYSTFFQDIQDTSGFKYLEIGGFDGISESNSRFFDVCLHWDGILVEPNHFTYEKLVVNRPNAHRLSYAASCSQEDANQGKTVGFYATEYSNAAQVGTDNGYKNDPSAAKPIQVPCGPLTPVIQDLLGGHIHFMSLDVEGAEPLVLKQGMDFTKLYIEVLIVENWNWFCKEECETRDQARKFLTEEANYALFPGLVKFSDTYVHKKSPLLQKVPADAKRLDKH